NSSSTWNSLTEVRIHGTSSATSGAGADAAAPADAASADATTAPDGPPASTLTYPAQLLNLTNWKLTLPIDTSAPGSPDEILQPALATFKIDPYFELNPSSTGVLFNAPCGGATTGGSSYPRSELREMSSGGSTAASWSTTSGTHTMVVREAITHLPV